MNTAIPGRSAASLRRSVSRVTTHKIYPVGGADEGRVEVPSADPVAHQSSSHAFSLLSNAVRSEPLVGVPQHGGGDLEPFDAAKRGVLVLDIHEHVGVDLVQGP